MGKQVLKLSEEEVQALLEAGIDLEELEEIVAEEEQKAPASKPVSKISIGVHARSSASLPDTAVDVVKFVQILKMNLGIEFTVDVSVGVNPTLAVPAGGEKSKSIGFSVEAESAEE